MSPEVLEAIAKRATAATDGPWETKWDGTIGRPPAVIRAANIPPRRIPATSDDSSFIAHARRDVPDLLAEVAWLKAENLALSATLTDARAAMDTAEHALDLVSGSEAQPMAAAEVRAALADIRAARGGT
jgi:hypothetical protein